MIASIEGRMGQGKTLSATFIAVADQEQYGKYIFSTYHLFNVYKCPICEVPHQLVATDRETMQEVVLIETASEEDKLNYLWLYACDEAGVLAKEEIKAVEDPQQDENVHWLEWKFLTLEAFYEIFNAADQGLKILDNCDFILDESYLFMDARASASKVNRVFNAFVFQTRKRGVDMYLTTHAVNRLDRRVREALDLKISARFNSLTQVIRLRIRDMHTGDRRTISVLDPGVYAYYRTDETVVPQGKLYRLKVEDLR